MQIRQIFEDALEQAPHGRSAFIAEVCSDDPELQHEVECLLAQITPGDESAAAFSSLPRQIIGPYRLLQRLGEGGMGEVWLAEQAQPISRRVAVKIIKAGMDTKQVVARFESERQALAMMDHPAIAKVFEAGSTAEGRPYFAMEYVPGVSITAHCDTHRLPTRERLELFIKVCEGVQHAHQKAIIHRDLKPSNILISIQDGCAGPKIIDFGVAKAIAQPLTDKTMFTEFGAMIGTPEYMSPEQAQLTAQDVDTRTDVYSLGVVLYELLVGALPFDSDDLRHAGCDGIRRTILEQEPPRPSTKLRTLGAGSAVAAKNRSTDTASLAHQLNGDIDWITMKAIEKDRARRYSSPSDLASDIQRYLASEPVLAHPPGVAYRAKKFVRRHGPGVVAAASIVLTLVGGLVATALEAKVAREQKARAERRFNDVRKLANWFVLDFHNSIASLAGATPARKLLVSKSLEYLDSLAKEAAGDAALQHDLAVAYLTLGDVQNGTVIAAPNLGDSAGALDSYRKAAAIGEALVAAHPKDTAARRDLAIAYDDIGIILGTSRGDLARQLASYRKARTLREALVASDPADVRTRKDLAVSEFKIGQVLRDTREAAGALEQYRKALATYDPVSQADSQKSRLRFTVAVQGAMGVVLAESGDTVGALENFRKALATRQELAQDPNDAVAQAELAIAYERVGNVLGRPGQPNMGDPKGAEEFYRKSLEIRQKLLAADPSNAVARRDLMISHDSLGGILSHAGNRQGALNSHRAALSLSEQLASQEPAAARSQLDLAWNRLYMGRLLADMGDAAGGLENLRQGLASVQQQFSKSPNNIEVTQLIETIVPAMAKIESRAGHMDAARQLTRRALGFEKERAERTGATAMEHLDYASSLLDCEPADLQDPVTALQHVRRAVEMTNEKNPHFLDFLAQVYFRTGDARAAVEAEEKALALLTSSQTSKETSGFKSELEANLSKYRKAVLPK